MDGRSGFCRRVDRLFKIAPEDLPMLIDETRARSAGGISDSYGDEVRALVLAIVSLQRRYWHAFDRIDFLRNLHAQGCGPASSRRP